MKKIKLEIDDLISVLEAMRDSAGTKSVILFELDGLPALADADEPENVVMFETFDPEQEDVDGNAIH